MSNTSPYPRAGLQRQILVVRFSSLKAGGYGLAFMLGAVLLSLIVG